MAIALDQLDAIRASYDAVAGSYSALVREDLDRQPVQRGLLTAFAGMATGGRVVDAGCGPGHITAHLHGLGVDVSGVDLSPGMVEQAANNFPWLRFEVGSMAELAEADGSLAGLIAWFSTIHIPGAQFPGVLAEFHRVLSGGAPLMLAFQSGDTPQHVTERWGSKVDVTVHRRRPDVVAELLGAAGFHVVLNSVFEPAGRPGAQAACLIASRE